MKSGLKIKRRRKNRVKSREKNFKNFFVYALLLGGMKLRVKSREKNFKIFFCLRASTWRDEISLIKVAYLVLNFLNLKSFLRHLFFG